MVQKMTEYAIMVEPLAQADGGGWLATVPALPGCIGDGGDKGGVEFSTKRTAGVE